MLGFVVMLITFLLPWAAAAYIFLEKNEPRQVLVVLPITELAIALVRIDIGKVSRCRERTSLRTARSVTEPNT
jgi:hypothetical protein